MSEKKQRVQRPNFLAEKVQRPSMSLRKIQREVQSFVRQHHQLAKMEGKDEPGCSTNKGREKTMMERLIELGAKPPKGEKRSLAAHLKMTHKERKRKKKKMLEVDNSWEATHPPPVRASRESCRRRPSKRWLRRNELKEIVEERREVNMEELSSPDTGNGEGRNSEGGSQGAEAKERENSSSELSSSG